MDTYKIVLTGGPCGGKTESIQFLSKKLVELDYSVRMVGETANALLQLGYMPNRNISTFDFQNLLFKIQFLKEYVSEGMSEIILCDRGMFDGMVYIDNEGFQKILELNRLNKEKLVSTYDGVLYFRSIAHEYPDEFSKKRVYESPQVGMDRDECCFRIWEQKIISCNYNNVDGFRNKQELIYMALKERLEFLKAIKTINLSDYYGDEHFKYIYDGIDDILVKNNVSCDIKIRTKELIR